MPDSEHDPLVPTAERLAAIKAIGHARRRRDRIRVAVAVPVVLAAIAVPLALRSAQENRGSTGPLAAQGDGNCVDSADKTCGPFRWVPEPATDQPLQVALAADPIEAIAGEALTVNVTWSDPDAPSIGSQHVCWGDTTCAPPTQPCEPTPAHGPWTPPIADAGTGTVALSHTYDTPGIYMVEVTLVSRAWPEGCPPSAGDPYASSATTTAQIIVR